MANISFQEYNTLIKELQIETKRYKKVTGASFYDSALFTRAMIAALANTTLGKQVLGEEVRIMQYDPWFTVNETKS